MNDRRILVTFVVSWRFFLFFFLLCSERMVGIDASFIFFGRYLPPLLAKCRLDTIKWLYYGFSYRKRKVKTAAFFEFAAYLDGSVM